jgi:hypothetical protein
MAVIFNPKTKKYEAVMDALGSSNSGLSSSALRKKTRLEQYGYETEPEQNLVEKALNLKPDRSVLENLLDLLPRSEAASASLLGGLNQGLGFGESLKRAKEALKGNRKYTYTDLLKEAGMGDNWGTKAAGFVLGNALDPLSYVPIGKIAGAGIDVGRKIPGVKSVIGVGDDVMKGVRKAIGYGYQDITDKGLKNLDTILRGQGSGSTAYELTQNSKKYLPLLEKLKGISDEESVLIGMAREKSKYLKKLSPEGKELLGLLDNLFTETGAQKKIAGTVKGLIGEGVTTKEAVNTIADAIKAGDVDGARDLWKTFNKEIKLPKFSKFVDGTADLSGKVAGLKGAWKVKEAEAYLPHLFTDEFRKYAKEMGKTPDEMIELMKGMSRRNIAKLEKSRSLLGNIAEYNVQSQKLYKNAAGEGIKMFEDDIKKILPKYMYNHSRNTALMEMGGEILKLTDDAGSPLIKAMGKKKAIPAGMVQLSGLPFKDGFYTTPEIAKQINKVGGILTSDAEVNKFLKVYDKALGKWKKMVTAFNPTFTPTNVIGGNLNMWTANPDSLSIDTLTKMGKILKDTPVEIVSKNGKKITGQKLLEMGERLGAMSGEITPESILKTGPMSKINRGVEKYGYGAEKMMRLQTMISEFKKTGDVMDAVRETWRVHGNYNVEALGTLERTGLKRVVPFINWAKTNIPFQINSLINNTDKYAKMARLQNLMVSPEERENLPEYLRNQVLFPGKTAADGTKSYRSIGLPASDLNRFNPTSLSNLGKGVKETFLGNANPFLKTPLELAFNKNLYYDQEIWNKNLPKSMRTGTAPQIVQFIPEKIRDLIGIKKSTTTSSITGKEKTKYEINAALAHSMNQLLGTFNKFSNSPKTMEKEMTALGLPKTAVGELIAMMSAVANPFKVNTFDPKEQEYYSKKAEEDRLQEMINYLMNRGLIPRIK